MHKYDNNNLLSIQSSHTTQLKHVDYNHKIIFHICISKKIFSPNFVISSQIRYKTSLNKLKNVETIKTVQTTKIVRSPHPDTIEFNLTPFNFHLNSCPPLQITPKVSLSNSLENYRLEYQIIQMLQLTPNSLYL